MADIRLARPAAGASESVACSPEARFVFDFPTSEATLARNGDSLTITFSDGASLNLEGFYEEYNKENLPSFTIDGMEVAAADFFNAMNEPDLMPAAGPAAGGTPTGGRFHQYDNMDLADGIDHLNGLDWGMNRPPVEEIARNAFGDDGGDEGDQLFAAAEVPPAEPPVNHPVDVTPENPGELPPDTPEIGDMDLPRDVLLVKEEDLRGGDDAVVAGAMKIDAPDGVASIVIGDVTVWENGALTASTEITTPEGKLTVTGFDPATGRLEYSYTLTDAATHGDQGNDNIFHNFQVTVTDVDGDSASSEITVVIQDDMPEIGKSTQAQTQRVEDTSKLDFCIDSDTPLNSLSDFKAHGWTDAQPNEAYQNQTHVGYIGGLKVVPTFVEYTFDTSGNFVADHLEDWTSNLLKSGTEIGVKWDEKALFFHKTLQISKDGLSVGKTWGFGQGNDENDGRYDIGTNQYQPDKGNAGVPHQSEAIVLETENTSVSYGLDIELGRFEGNDTALICFYLTPRNNNDNNLVKMIEVKASDYPDGKISIDVPDGFNKVIVAPIIGKGDDGTITDSGLTIKNIAFNKPAWEQSGEVPMQGGADGLTKGGMNWDWSESGLQDAPVQISGSLGAGEYTVRLQFDGTHVKAILEGNADKSFSLNGNTLFEGELDPKTGEWTIKQYYKFTTSDDNKDELDVRFSVTDVDGDTTTVTRSVDLHLEEDLDRFDNVELGTWDKNWGFNAENDNAADVVSGGSKLNDLMYGRGGNDLMFGDGGDDAVSRLITVLNQYGSQIDPNMSIEDIEKDLAITGVQNDRVTLKSEIWTALNSARGEGDEGSRLEAILTALEKAEGEGGDDALFGGLGWDILFGGGGDDFLSGNGKNVPGGQVTYKDHDMLFGGAGNDIIVYDADDFIIHGGDGVDLLLAGSNAPNLDAMLAKNTYSPYINSIEVLLRTHDTTHVENLGITSHKSLLEYGIRIEGNMLLLAAAWGEGVLNGNIWEYTCEVDGHKLTLQTTLPKEQIGVLPEATTPADAVTGDEANAQAMAAASADLSDNSDGPDAASAEEASGALNEGLNTLSALDATPEAHEQTLAVNARAAAADNHDAVTGNADAPVSANGEADGGTAVDGDLNAFLAQVESLGGDRGDALIFGNGDDVIAGTEGRDFIYAGDGDDLILYDPTDYLIDGGDGIDFLLAGAGNNPSLGDLLTNDSAGNGMPMVNGVEVLLKGENVGDIMSLDDLKALGISLGEDGKSLTLDKGWQQGSSKTFGEGNGKVTVTTWTNGDVTLETTLQSAASPESEADQAAQTLVLTING